MSVSGKSAGAGGPEGAGEDRRVLVAALICAGLLVGWFLVSQAGILDDVMPEVSSDFRDF